MTHIIRLEWITNVGLLSYLWSWLVEEGVRVLALPWGWLVVSSLNSETLLFQEMVICLCLRLLLILRHLWLLLILWRLCWCLESPILVLLRLLVWVSVSACWLRVLRLVGKLIRFAVLGVLILRDVVNVTSRVAVIKRSWLHTVLHVELHLKLLYFLFFHLSWRLPHFRGIYSTVTRAKIFAVFLVIHFFDDLWISLQSMSFHVLDVILTQLEW